MKKWKLIGVLTVLLLGILSCSACGKKEEWEIGVDGYVYVVQNSESYAELSSLIEEGEHFLVQGNSLYFLKALESGKTAICRVDFPEGEEGGFDYQEIVTDQGISAYTADLAGNVYYLARFSSSGVFVGSLADLNNAVRKGFLRGVDKDGNELFKVDDLEVPYLQMDIKYTYDCLSVDGDGLIYWLDPQQVSLFGPDGTSRGSIPLGDYAGRYEYSTLFLMKDGKENVFCVAEDKGPAVLALHPGANEPLSPFYVCSGAGFAEVYMDGNGLLIDEDDGILYSCRQEEKGFVQEPVLRWQDSDLVGNDVRDVVALPNGDFLTAYAGDREILLLKKTPLEDLPKKELVVLASLLPSSELSKAVVSFNRQSDRYRISLESFGSKRFAGQSVVDEAGARLDVMLISDNPPDLLDLTGLDIWKYAEKDVLADLTQLLGEEKVSVYPKKLREDYTIRERLVCIPRQFSLTTVVGRGKDVGSLAGGYDSQELMDVLNQLYAAGRGVMLNWEDRGYLLRTFFAREYLTKYIDWETGTCSFDDGDFGKLLEQIKGIQYEDGNTTGKLYGLEGVPDEVSLLQHWGTDFQWILDMEEWLGTDVVLLGYPTADGTPYHIAEVQDSIGIVEASSHKEGAVAFLESFLDADLYRTDSLSIPLFNYFPTREDEFEMMAQEAGTLRYVMNALGERVKNPDGTDQVMSGYVNEDRMKAMRAAIETADFLPFTVTEEQIIAIVCEEAEQYFSGAKSLEEVQGIMNNRISILLQEGM